MEAKDSCPACPGNSQKSDGNTMPQAIILPGSPVNIRRRLPRRLSLALPGPSRRPETARMHTTRGPHQRASLLSHKSSQAGTSTRAKAWVPTPYSWDRLARSIPHVAKWKHLASAPCRHQRLPASIIQPPRSPLAEETSACGKAERSGAYRTGGKSLLPHPLPRGLHSNAKRTKQFSTQAFIGGKVICTQV